MSDLDKSQCTYISLLQLDGIYFVAKEWDYTLTVQPVLYKRDNYADAAIWTAWICPV